MGKYLDMVRKFEERRQAEGRTEPQKTSLTAVPSRPAPGSWPCPRCGREATIEAVEPSLDGERMLTFWHCEPCQSYAVTPSTIKEPPKGWGTKVRQ
jgi:hypothetical protein